MIIIPQSSARDADKRALEQQLMDTENNLRNKLQELVRAQDQIEVLNEKINSLNYALSNRFLEVRSLRHEVDLLNQSFPPARSKQRLSVIKKACCTTVQHAFLF